MITDQQRAKVNELKDIFITAMLMINDATPEQLGHTGHKTKEAALASWVKHYRKQMHVILGD